jgi:hypothetical protein
MVLAKGRHWGGEGVGCRFYSCARVSIYNRGLKDLSPLQAGFYRLVPMFTSRFYEPFTKGVYCPLGRKIPHLVACPGLVILTDEPIPIFTWQTVLTL